MDAENQDFKILFVDDSKPILAMVEKYLRPRGYNLTVANSGPKALKLVMSGHFDLVFTDLVMPGMGGMELLTEIKTRYPETEVIVITGFATIESAIEALKQGSYDYLQKPIKLERLRVLIDRILEKKKLQRENLLIKQRLKERYKYDDLIGVSPKMQKVYEIIDRISLGNSPTVLIEGESGTGKELVAKIIHKNSDRRLKPFIPVNCGAMPEGLLESELFGHVKGAFTGAIQDKKGLFQAAEGGTLFLDEVAEMPPSLQVKLLRVLQEKTVRPVGGTREFSVNTRVIAATNRDLNQAIRDGDFRKDLYYRLNIVSINMPALADHAEDIPLLINHFVKQFNATSKKKIRKIHQTAMDMLLRYHWPGNVRQLENVIERAFALGVSGMLNPADLPSEIRQGNEGEDAAGLVGADKRQAEGDMVRVYDLKENEIMLIHKALQETLGNKAEAARLLGINLSTLYRKIEKYGLSLPV